MQVPLLAPRELGMPPRRAVCALEAPAAEHEPRLLCCERHAASADVQHKSINAYPCRPDFGAFTHPSTPSGSSPRMLAVRC